VTKPKLRPGDVYRHYKGDLYVIVCEAKHEEDQKPLVVYRSREFPEQVWVRSLVQFHSYVTKKSENGFACGVIPRFEPALLTEEESRA